MKKLTGVLCACMLAIAANAQVYVSVTGAGNKDGSSWDNATDNIVSAIATAKAAAVKEVRMAAGTYAADWGTIGTATASGVTLYGGFNGEDAPEKRAKVANGKAYDFANPTLLTSNGVIGVIAGDPFTVDGITFTQRTLQLACRNNVVFKNCTWKDNIHEKNTINPYMNDNETLSTIFENCLFLNNKGTSGSNIIQVNGKATAKIYFTNCDFIGNESTHHILSIGGIGSVVNCRFYNNTPGAAGGTVITANNGELINNLIVNNTCPVTAINGSATIINSTIANNVAPQAILLTAATAKVYNTIVLGNVDAAGESVGIAAKEGLEGGEVKNSAFPGTLDIMIDGLNNLSFVPTLMPFVAPSAFKGADATKQDELLATDWSLIVKPHALIDGGDNALYNAATNAPTTDLAGNTRIQNTTIDLGAYENAAAAPALPTLSTTASEGGTVSPALANADKHWGQPIELTATPADGSEFVNWTLTDGTILSDKLDYTFEMPETAATVKANFKVATEKYTLTVTAGENGAVSSEGGQYFAGSKVELTATPDAEYKFAGWYDVDGNLISEANPYTLTIEKLDITVKATFKYHLTRYLVSPSANEDGYAPEWERAAVKGETIINLNKVVIDGVETQKSLDQFFIEDLWPAPLSAGDEIWLLGSDFETYNAIEIKAKGVKIFGGFEGIETDISQRERDDLDGNGVTEPWEFIYPSVLAGKMQIIEFNSSVLLLHADNLLVDGLVVEGGQQAAVDYGVGVNLGVRNTLGSGAIMRNSIIRRNVVTNKVPSNATAYVCAVFVWQKSLLESSLIENNLIDATNTAAAYAAGVHVDGGTIKDCTVRNNRNMAFGTKNGDVHGGGIRISEGMAINCLVSNNYAQRGAGIYLLANEKAIVRYCTVVNNKCGMTGGGVYFRARQSDKAGGLMQNSIVWNNVSETDPQNNSNIYIEGDGRTTKDVKLGVNAFNGQSAIRNDAIGNFYTSTTDKSSLETLPMVDVFTNPLSIVGYNENEIWESDWSPKLAGLGIAIPIAEGEKDILGRMRKEADGALGAYEFGSPVNINNGTVDLDPFVYTSHGGLRVSFFQPVAVEIFDITGALLQSAAAKNDHVFDLPKGGIYMVVVKTADKSCTRKIAIQ